MRVPAVDFRPQKLNQLQMVHGYLHAVFPIEFPAFESITGCEQYKTNSALMIRDRQECNDSHTQWSACISSGSQEVRMWEVAIL